jgi:hypothetical protein
MAEEIPRIPVEIPPATFHVWCDEDGMIAPPVTTRNGDHLIVHNVPEWLMNGEMYERKRRMKNERHP